MVHKGTNSPDRSVTYLASFSFLSSKRLCILDLHGVVVIFLVTSISLLYSELSLLGLALDLVD